MEITRSRDDRGAALVEFALVLPMLVLLLVATIEFGFAMFHLQGLHSASRDAARLGSYAATTSAEIEERALDRLSEVQLEAQPQVTITPNTELPCDGSVDSVVVEISVEEPLIIPFWQQVTVDLTSRSEFACEG